MSFQSTRRSEAELQREYASLIANIPTKAEIFLPTEKVPLAEKVRGMLHVRRIYARDLDRVYRPQLRALRDACVGHRRCFIIGNGPSLNRTDLTKLKCEVTFAVNGFFLRAQDFDWKPTFYVVEDHLVAEDRKSQIDAFKGPTKLFPAYLGYCFDHARDTIFFNHLPRKSYPDGFDFSTDAAQVTYTGCTVTFTCLQLAYYLGFKEIYLIGVDADYAIPKDVEQQKMYGVGVLDMKSDDPNHFDPNYFGKGYRWHDPQLDKMIDAYKEARKASETAGSRILNATVGGKLEVFDRVRYDSLFPRARSPVTREPGTSRVPVDAAQLQDELENANKIVALRELPRLLVIDQTLIGDGTATGEIKRSFFKTWPQDRFLQIYCSRFSDIGVHGLEVAPGFEPSNLSLEDALVLARGFAPQAILYRPTPNQPTLHKTALAIIDQLLKVPLVVWIMDDWLAPLQRTQPGAYQELDRDVRRLLKQARLRLSICDEMSAAFEERYGVPFKAFANGIDPDDWPIKSSSETRAGPFRVRYAGSLAHDMNLHSILRIAQAVEELAAEGLSVSFEMKTGLYWDLLTRKHFKRFKKTSTMTANLSEEDYRRWLCDADIIIIAYNFDEHSLEYVKYSRANKLPECLASGAALLVHGPTGLPTVNFVAKHHCGAIVSCEDLATLKDTLRRLIQSEDERKILGARARETAFEECDLRKLREALRSEIATIATSQPNVSETDQALTPAYPLSAQAYVDETKVIALLRVKDSAAEPKMIHVSARAGSGAKHMAEKGWTVHRFEPGPENASQPTRTFNENPNARTLAESMQERNLERIDLLKISVDASSSSVLKGVPWDTVRPSVIECECNEAMTLEMGVTFRDNADYLAAKGYSVYISEWHPIARGGTPHNWYRLKRYPCELAQPKGLGKLLAFRSDPGGSQLAEAFNAHLKTRKISPSPQSQEVIAELLPPLAQSFIRLRWSVGNWLRMRHPRLYGMAARAERRVLHLVR